MLLHQHRQQTRLQEMLHHSKIALITGPNSRLTKWICLKKGILVNCRQTMEAIWIIGPSFPIENPWIVNQKSEWMKPVTKAEVRPTTFAIRVRKDRYLRISTPDRIHLISGIPEPAACGLINTTENQQMQAKKRLKSNHKNQLSQKLSPPNRENIIWTSSSN